MSAIVMGLWRDDVLQGRRLLEVVPKEVVVDEWASFEAPFSFRSF